MTGHNNSPAIRPPAEKRETELGTEQKCTGCNQWWPLDEEFFHRGSHATNGYKTRCRDCSNSYYRTKAQARTDSLPKPKPVPEVFRAVQWGGQ